MHLYGTQCLRNSSAQSSLGNHGVSSLQSCCDREDVVGNIPRSPDYECGTINFTALFLNSCE